MIYTTRESNARQLKSARQVFRNYSVKSAIYHEASAKLQSKKIHVATLITIQLDGVRDIARQCLLTVNQAADGESQLELAGS